MFVTADIHPKSNVRLQRRLDLLLGEINNQVYEQKLKPKRKNVVSAFCLSHLHIASKFWSEIQQLQTPFM